MKKILILSMIGLTCWIYTNAQSLKTPTLSPYSEVKQEVGLTELTLQYSRPSAKGRKIFGALVPYEQIWRTGANASTKISFDEALKIGGKDISPGTYAIYSIPGMKSWTIIIHSNTRHRSIAGRYKQEEDVFRFETDVIVNPKHVETFTLQFTDIKTNSCNLQLSWEHQLVNIPIELDVDSKIESQMTEFLKDPESIPHRTYFEAAQYYLHNKKDLNLALEWIDAALEKSKKNFRYGLLKAKILNASGNRQMAIVVINEAHGWAVNANNANYIEQTALFRKSLMDR